MRTTAKRLSRLEAARQSSIPARVFVIIGSDEPRHPGEITIGGKATNETPLDSDIVPYAFYVLDNLVKPVVQYP